MTDQQSSNTSFKRRLLAGGVVVLAFTAVGVGVTQVGPLADGPNTGGSETTPWEKPGWSNSGVPGDRDGNGSLSTSEKADLKKTQDSLAIAVKALAPEGAHIDTKIITPTGVKWWQFVTHQAQSTTLPPDAMPHDASWYAVTQGRSKGSAEFPAAYYESLHLGFRDVTTAEAWRDNGFAQGNLVGVRVVLRGPVATVIPAWVEPGSEGFASVDAKAIAGVEAHEGLWVVDFDKQIDKKSVESADPVAYKTMWRELGFAGTSWTGTSPSPSEAWVGRLEGFESSSVSAEDAIAEINLSAFSCHGEPGVPKRSCDNPYGISRVIDNVFIRDQKIGGGEETLLPDDVPSDALLAFSYNASFESLSLGENRLTVGDLEKVDMWVTKSGELTMRQTYTD